MTRRPAAVKSARRSRVRRSMFQTACSPFRSISARHAFPGADRYLQITVKRPTDTNYTTLTPRQQFSSTPYAIQALNATTADTATTATATATATTATNAQQQSNCRCRSGRFVVRRAAEQSSARHCHSAAGNRYQRFNFNHFLQRDE